MIRKIYIPQHERGPLFPRGGFIELLIPGSRWIVGRRKHVEIVDTLKPRFEHPLLDVLIDQPVLRAQLMIVELAELERAIVWKDGRVLQILGPGRHAFWKPLASSSSKLDV